MFKSISYYFNGFTILNYVCVKYSQNELKLAKSKFIEHWSMSALLKWVVPEALVELTTSFFGRISSSLITEREQPPRLHLAEQVSRMYSGCLQNPIWSQGWQCQVLLERTQGCPVCLLLSTWWGQMG